MTATFLSYAFRPFFLANSLFAIIAILVWVLLLHGVLPDLQLANPLLWHGHEMLIGFALATVAGFLLTAVATWANLPSVHGSALVWLIIAWLLGRVAMLSSGVLPYGMVTLLDMTFPVLLVAMIAREIIKGRSQRNYPIIGIALVIALLNLGYHAGASGVLAGMDRVSVYLLVHLFLLLIVVIAGRIVPSFTANWMRAQGKDNLPTSQAAVDRTAITLTLLTGVAASLAPVHVATGVLAFAAAAAHTIRLARWRGLATLEEPLVFILHVAYAWLPIGYALTGCAALGWWLPSGAALHALTMGAIGMMIMAVTTRVALGHTGRALHASRLTVISYCIFNLAVVLRVAGPMLPFDYLALVDGAALGWIVSFALFVWVYWPVLTGPKQEN